MAHLALTGAREQRRSVWLGLGGNLGDRAEHLRDALDRLVPVCGPFTLSSTYETLPWGEIDQPPFLNLVARGETPLNPAALLEHCKAVERALGREPARRWGPRVVDVDILAYGDVVLATSDLQIPHPQLHRRAFVLVPLVEVDPQWRHPLLDQTAQELLEALPPEETAGIRVWSAPCAGGEP